MQQNPKGAGRSSGAAGVVRWAPNQSVAMKRYYFDLRDGSQFIRDDEGVELPDIESARQEATAALSEITRGWDGGGPQHRMAVEVRDDRGPILEARVSFEIKQRDVIGFG